MGKTVLHRVRAFVGACLLAAASLSAVPASAQAAFNDDGASYSESRLAGRPFTASLIVSAPYTVTSIAVRTLATTPHNVKFVIWNTNTNSLVYETPSKAFAADTASSIKTSDVFAAVTLQSGVRYVVAAVSDVTATSYGEFGPLTQGLVTSEGNGEGTFASPSFSCCGGVRGNLAMNLAPPVPAITGLAPANGSTAGGTQVVITGTNLSSATAVTFGGAAGAITANTATSITVTSPTRPAGVADVVVTTAGGSSPNTVADDFTYAVPPVPTLSEWAMILLGAILAGGAALTIQRRRLPV